jgi:hypothetical protein
MQQNIISYTEYRQTKRNGTESKGLSSVSI